MFHSHFGVYAIILNPAKTKILLIEKARGPYLGLWDLPGGSMEVHELLEDTLVREIKEETGCDITDFHQIKTDSLLYNYYDHKMDEAKTLRHIGVLYWTEILGQIKKSGDGEDSNGCDWLDIKSLNEKNASPFVLKAIALI